MRPRARPSSLGFGTAKPTEPEGGHVRVTTAFNKMLAIPGASMAGVEFGPEGIVAALRPPQAAA